MKRVFVVILKTLACGLIFFVGTILGGLAASSIGLPVPSMPIGTDSATLVGYLLLASLGIGALLAYCATRLRGSFLQRELTLAAFGWVLYSLSTYIEAAIYTTFSSASLYKVVMDMVAFLASSGAAVLFFRPNPQDPQWQARFSITGWVWRIAIAWAAFPVIYLSFGKIVEPFVIDFYRQGLFELTAPGWEQILSAQMLRSLLFVAVCVALMGRWNGSRISLWINLTTALFLLVGGFYMLQAYWFPIGFRGVHCLEIFADSIAYAGCLMACFTPWQKNTAKSIEIRPMAAE